MVTIDEALADLYKAGAISLKTVMSTCNDSNEVKKYLGSQSAPSTTRDKRRADTPLVGNPVTRHFLPH